jgi:hypothetical protein
VTAAQPGRQGRPWRTAAAAVRARAACGEPCWVCGHRIDLSLPPRTPWSFSVDHAVQLCDGGHPTDPANLRPAHLRHNVQRSNRLRARRRVRRKAPLPVW